MARDRGEIEREMRRAGARPRSARSPPSRRRHIVKRLPKTRSGKILRGTMRQIADGEDYRDAGDDRRSGDPRRDHRGAERAGASAGASLTIRPGGRPAGFPSHEERDETRGQDRHRHGRGQGHRPACAERFVRDGARVALVDIDDKAGEAAAARSATIPRSTTSIATSPSGSRSTTCWPRRIERFGRVDILVNNAGIVHGADFLDIEEADFDRVLRVNLKGVVPHRPGRRAPDGRAGQGGRARRAPSSTCRSVNAVFAHRPTRCPTRSRRAASTSSPR